MSEATMNGTSVQRAESSSRASVLRRLRTSDLVFHGLTRAAAITVLVLLSGVILALIIGVGAGAQHLRPVASSPPRCGTR